MRRYSGLILLVTGLFAANAASASDNEENEPRLTATTSVEFMTGEIDGTDFQLGGLGASLRYDIVRRVSIEVGLQASVLTVGFRDQLLDGLVADGAFMTPLQPSARLHLLWSPLRTARHRLELRGGVESSLPSVPPHMTRLHIRTDDGAFDVSGFGRSELTNALFWQRFGLGMRYALRFGAFEPSVGLAFEALRVAVDLNLTETGAATLRSLGFDDRRISRRYAASRVVWIIPITLGLGYRFDDANLLGCVGTFGPGGGPLLGASLAYGHLW